MRRLLAVFTLLMFSAVLARAQDDHNDNSPVVAGYAVVTPVSATSGLAVFETFGYRLGLSGVPQAGVLPANLTTNAVLFCDTNGRLGKNIGVAIVNPNATSASVSLTLRNGSGATVAGPLVVSVASHQQVSKYIDQLFVGAVPDLQGSLLVTSNAPVAVMGLRFRGINFSTLPATSLSADVAVPVIAPGVGGPGSILLPQFAGGGGWASQVVVMNTTAATLTVRIDLFKQDGTPLSLTLNHVLNSTFTTMLPAGGTYTLAPLDRIGNDDF